MSDDFLIHVAMYYNLTLMSACYIMSIIYSKYNTCLGRNIFLNHGSFMFQLSVCSRCDHVFISITKEQ